MDIIKDMLIHFVNPKTWLEFIGLLMTFAITAGLGGYFLILFLLLATGDI